MRGVVAAGTEPRAEVLAALDACPSMEGLDLASRVSTREQYSWGDPSSPYHIVFSGHTHFRHAHDERGPLDVSTGRLSLNPQRRYRINPGALTAGQFGIWDRAASLVRFCTTRS